MKACELMNELFALAPNGNYENTCDTCKAGDPQREVRRVAVTMFPTVDVIRQAAWWGADLLIVHEPLYFNHMDVHSDEQVETEKRRLLEETGMTVYRYHDHPHNASSDMIAAGFWEKLALPGKTIWNRRFDLAEVELDAPVTPLLLAKRIEEKLGLRHVRVSGAVNASCTRVMSVLGAPGNCLDLLREPGCQILIGGEVSEWAMGEYVRDAAALGHKKALITLGHAGSEGAGMEYVRNLIAARYSDLPCRYLDCGEVFHYTEEL